MKGLFGACCSALFALCGTTLVAGENAGTDELEVACAKAAKVPMRADRIAPPRSERTLGLSPSGGGGKHARQKTYGMEAMPPSADIWKRLSQDEQDFLEDHRDLLDGHGELIRALPTLSPEARQAAEKFLTFSLLEVGGVHHLQRPPEAPREQTSDQSSVHQERIDHHDTPPRVECYLQWALQAEQQTVYRGKRSVPDESSVWLTPVPKRIPADGYPHHSQLRELHSGERLRLARIPHYGIAAASANFILPTTHGAIRMFSQSSFGGAMLVEESRSMVLDFGGARRPDFHIAGHGAYVVLEKHGSGEPDDWVTTIHAHDGAKAYSVEVVGKLEGADRERLMRFTRDLLAGS